MLFTTGAMFTLTQALQLVGLVPALFLMFFLLTLMPRNRQALIPALYFLSLACGFAVPLLDLYPDWENNKWAMGGMLLGESVLVAFSFLLILQFMNGRIPGLPYWLVLAIPLVGGGSLIYASILQAGEACTHDCTDVTSIKTLYNIFSSSFVFLLLVYYSSRSSGPNSDDIHKRHKYWLIISLILLHLFVLAVDLAKLSDHMTPEQAEFTATVLRLTFIYLVLTSLFRVFYPNLVTQAIQLAVTGGKRYDEVLDKPHVEKLKSLLNDEHVYREMRLNRAALAQKVGIGEHHLSRVINGHFGKNFNELINGYRIDEAKRRLRAEPTQVTVIAFEVGFNSIASFNRVFKEMVGTSPTEYRNSGIS